MYVVKNATLMRMPFDEWLTSDCANATQQDVEVLYDLPLTVNLTDVAKLTVIGGSVFLRSFVQSSAKHDGVTIPLQKHVFAPNVRWRTLYSLPDTYWTFATQIGAQTLELALDTGMSATILMTDDVDSYYDRKLSPSYRDAGRSTCGWKMPYLPYLDSWDLLYRLNNATIDVKGSWATDEFRFGEDPHIFSVTPFILTRLLRSTQFMGGGALGLALGIDDSKGSLENTNGAITFGGRDELHCDTDWVEASGDWMVRLTEVNVGPTPILSSPTRKVVVGARISVSTPFLELPYDEYVEVVATLRYFANITDSETPGIVLVDCADVARLPSVGIHMGDVSVIVSAEEYTTASEIDPNTCVILIILASPGAWTLGLPFLPKGCISYDYENAVLGFAKPANQ